MRILFHTLHNKNKIFRWVNHKLRLNCSFRFLSHLDSRACLQRSLCRCCGEFLQDNKVDGHQQDGQNTRAVVTTIKETHPFLVENKPINWLEINLMRNLLIKKPVEKGKKVQENRPYMGSFCSGSRKVIHPSHKDKDQPVCLCGEINGSICKS